MEQMVIKYWFGSWQGITTICSENKSSDMYLKEVITPQKNIFKEI